MYKSRISTRVVWCSSLTALTLFISLFSMLSYAGVVVGATRFIYGSESQNGITFTVKNTDSLAYLIQAKVIADDGKSTAGSVLDQTFVGKSPFIITPPLFSLGPEKENSLRVIRTGGDLAMDRESLFGLTLAAIPGGKSGPNSLQVAVRSHFKLFFRPENLKGNPAHAYEKLTWQRHASEISVSNPTPFYVTLFQLTVNGKVIENAGMVAPFSTRTQSWCSTDGECVLQWQSINDFGGVMPAWQVSPTTEARIGQSHND